VTYRLTVSALPLGLYFVFGAALFLYLQFSFVAFGSVPYRDTSLPVLRSVVTYRLSESRPLCFCWFGSVMFVFSSFGLLCYCL